MSNPSELERVFGEPKVVPNGPDDFDIEEGAPPGTEEELEELENVNALLGERVERSREEGRVGTGWNYE